MIWTINNFDKYVKQGLVEEGQRLFNQKRVYDITQTNEGAWTAYVEGNHDEFAVRIAFKGSEITKSNCTCSYNGELCEHAFGLLFALRQQFSEIPNRTAETLVQGPDGVYTTQSDKNMHSDYSPEGLYKAYKNLPEAEQRVLKIAALVHEPFSMTKMVEIFNSCFQYMGKALTASWAKIWLMEHNQAAFLLYLPTGQYRIKADFADFLLENEFEKDRDFRALLPKIQRLMEPSHIRYRDFEPSERYFREARFAFYLGKVEDFRLNYNQTIQNSNGIAKFSQKELLKHYLPDALDVAKLEKIPLSIRAFLLNEKLTLTFFDLTPTDDYFDYVVKNLKNLSESDRPNIARMLAQIAMFKGDWALVAQVSDYFDDIQSAVFFGWQTLLRGNANEAVEIFNTGAKAVRKMSKNPKDFLGGVGAIFQILAQLKTQDTSLFSKIESHHKSLSKYYGIFNQVYDSLLAVLNNLKNEKGLAKRTLQNILPNSEQNRFFIYICIFLVDEKMLPMSTVKTLTERLLKNGYNWMAFELLTMLNRIEPSVEKWETELEKLKTTPLSKNANFDNLESLIDLVPRIEEWESALNALLGLTSTAPQKVAKENDARLIWLVDFENYQIQPKEQVYGKTGWSAGRNVALHRLLRGEVNCMTDQDRRISRGIKQYYGWSGGNEYIIDTDKAIPELVGHPLLFLYKSPQVAVQLVEDKPVLVAKEVKEGYELSFSQKIEGTGWSVMKESPTRYKLLKITEEHARIARAMNGNKLIVPKKGRERLQKVVEGLSNIVTVQSAFETTDNLPVVEPDLRTCVHLLPVGDGFHVEFYAKPFGLNPPYFKPGIGEPTVIADLGGAKVQTKRDLKKEKENYQNLLEKLDILRGIQPNLNTYELSDADTCLQFLLELQPMVANEDIILEWPKGEKFRITKVVGFEQFSMNIKEKNDWFEVKGELRVDENMVLDMQRLLQLSESKSQFIELSPGKFLALTNEFRKRLQEINGLMNPLKDGSLQLHRLAAPAMSVFTDELQHFNFDKKYQKNLDLLQKAFKTKFKVPENFNASLREYQIEGFQWLSRLAKWGVGACLADDMGLGKTVQALALVLDRAENGPTLVVAPASVCRNWVAEIGKFTPDLNAILFGEGDREAAIDQAGANDIIITTYDLMTREAEHFTKKKFTTIILDEAQAIKNRATKRSETAMQLQGDFKILTTGTPLENHLGELWNLFQFINPGLFGSLDRFTEKFAAPIEKYRDDNRRDQLRRLVQPFMLRRRKDDVLKELPPKTEIQLLVELTPDERAFYEALRRQALQNLEGSPNTEGGQKHLQILAEIMRLRRAACHPRLVDEKADFVESSKLRLFGEIVEELIENGHKALVFSQFVGHLGILETYLKKKKIVYQYLDGSTPLNKRQERIEAFQRGEGDLFLISLKAGGVGLNLTAADYVIHMDPWWNPAVEDQATDRAHRIGQEKPVTVYRLVTEGTIEEKILKLHEQKRDLADSLLEGADVSARLSADDLLALIKSR
ncbi:MAG: DEAD/DEAH box helicase [Saprospiraceae bacterium]|nr:DEAD/DEAH box helicase [Saprospiraceae bacterium]